MQFAVRGLVPEPWPSVLHRLNEIVFSEIKVPRLCICPFQPLVQAERRLSLLAEDDEPEE